MLKLYSIQPHRVRLAAVGMAKGCTFAMFTRAFSQAAGAPIEYSVEK